MTFAIANRFIGPESPPYIIAEISANHNGSIENAYRLIDEAAQAGADAVKIQTYTPDTLTLNCSKSDFLIDSGLWKGETLYELYSRAYTPWEWHQPLFAYARKSSITIFSSPFDESAVDLLEDLGAPAYKIASFEAVDLSLIKYAASTKKPLIISTGMADELEISEAIDAARSSGCNDIALLHCVSGYPAPPSDYNLKTIPHLQKSYGVSIGLSDHTLENTTAIVSVALGASIIEKHFTLDRKAGGPDDSFSLEPAGLQHLVTSTKDAHSCLGKVNYARKSSEQENLKFRRSLYFCKDVRAGTTLDSSMVRSIRPGYGLPPKYVDKVIGMKVVKDVDFGTPISWDALSSEKKS